MGRTPNIVAVELPATQDRARRVRNLENVESYPRKLHAMIRERDGT